MTDTQTTPSDGPNRLSVTPKVSVIIPTYNAARLVSRAITSVLNQTLRDLEIVVVDDGSTDDTAAVVASFRDPRIRYVWQRNGERSAARNHGMALATGVYVAFLDADDWWVDSKLEKQLAVFRQNPAVGLVYSWVQQVGPQGEALRLISGSAPVGEAQGAEAFERILMCGLPGPGSSIMVSHACRAAVSEFREDLRYAEDLEFCLRAASKFQVGFVPEPLVYYQAYGIPLAAKLLHLSMPDALVKVVESGLTAAGLSPDHQLGREALANAYLSGALAEFAVGEYQTANRRLANAISLLRSSHFDGADRFVQSVVSFADMLYDTETPLTDALSFTRQLFSNLNGETRLLARYRKPCLAWIFANDVFKMQQQARLHTLRSFLSAVLLDLHWVRNRGLWSIAMRSLVSDHRR